MAKTKTAGQEKQDAILDDGATREIERLEAIEAMFFRIADNDDEIAFDDQRRIAALGLSPADVRTKIERAKRIRRFQDEAKTADERAAAAKLAGDAEAKRDAERPKLLSKIEQLNRQLADLDREARDLRQSADKMEFARMQLRKLVPEFVDRAVRTHIAGIRGAFNPRINVLEQSIRIYEHARNLAPGHRQTDLEPAINLGKAYGKVVGRLSGGSNTGSWEAAFDEAAWTQLVSELKEAAEAAGPRLETLRAEFAAAIEDANRNLDVYVS